ncbi:MAG: hypothetical protein JWQ48_4044, partial [Conexibacter sp.]|nr:hypothetical protein [Conexibacter sp.]
RGARRAAGPAPLARELASPAMDPFAAIMLGGLVVLILAIVALGLFYPGSGAEQLGWRSPREHDERDAVGDADDLEQMLAATNAHRRARGERELTLGELMRGEKAPPL